MASGSGYSQTERVRWDDTFISIHRSICQLCPVPLCTERQSVRDQTRNDSPPGILGGSFLSVLVSPLGYCILDRRTDPLKLGKLRLAKQNRVLIRGGVLSSLSDPARVVQCHRGASAG